MRAGGTAGFAWPENGVVVERIGMRDEAGLERVDGGIYMSTEQRSSAIQRIAAIGFPQSVSSFVYQRGTRRRFTSHAR